MQIESIGETFPHTNLQELINWLHVKQTEFIADGWTNLELMSDADNWDDKYDFVFFGVREETDKEYASRWKQIEEEKTIEKEKLNEHKKFIAAEAKRLGLFV